jgi:hypothetical protein
MAVSADMPVRVDETYWHWTLMMALTPKVKKKTIAQRSPVPLQPSQFTLSTAYICSAGNTLLQLQLEMRAATPMSGDTSWV